MRQRYRYAAVLALFLTAACDNGPSSPDDAVTKPLQVAPYRVECVGVGPSMCLQVRETSTAPWTNLHDEIVGFTHEPGFLYELLIKEETVENPPADASSIRRTLIRILSKTQAPPLEHTTWRLSSIEGRKALDDVRVTALFDGNDRIGGSAGCNGYGGRAVVKGSAITIGQLAWTLMACSAAGVMEQEQAYMSALEKVTFQQVVGSELRLGTAPGTVTLVYRAE